MDTAVDLKWRKSSYSGTNGGGCIEVAELPGGMAVRDSKNPQGPALAFDTAAWQAFARWARNHN